MMDRRKFLQGALAVGAIAVVPSAFDFARGGSFDVNPKATLLAESGPYSSMSISYATGGEYTVTIDAGGNSYKEVREFIKQHLAGYARQRHEIALLTGRVDLARVKG